MTISDVNIALGVILLFVGGAGVTIWFSPQGSAWLATILRARSLALDASRKAYKSVWVEHRPARQGRAAVVPIAERTPEGA